jgi:hypothetical protein
MNDTVDIFIADPDAPFTCPYDGARTDAVSNNGTVYKERCLHCGDLFYFEFDEDDYDNI